VDRIGDFTGSAGNDTFIGNTAAGAVTLTSLDAIDGGNGDDTLSITAVGAIDTTAAVGATVTGIENVDLVATTAITANTSSWTGVTSLTAVGRDASAITAATTTDVALTLAGLAVTDTVAVNGGNDVTVSTAVTATAAGAASVATTVGGTTAAAGNVVVSNVETVTDGANATAHVSSDITVTGGATVTVNSLASGGANDNANDIITIGAVGVTGNASTTTVSVTQSAAAARATTTMGITSGAVTIADGNANTAADTITSVTLAEYGATSSITSTVLTNLTLNGASSNALAGDLTIDQSAADTSTAATTLNVNLLGGHTGAIDGTQADVYTTVNFNTSAESTITDVNFAAATTLNFAGTAAATLAAATDIGAVTAINNTGSGAVTITPALGTGVTYTGGDAADTISIGATTKAITTGAGDDNVTIGATALGTGGTVDAGEGDADVLTMTFANAATATAATTFETKISGFERLAISGDVAADATVALANLDDINYVTVGDVDNTITATITGAQSGFTLVNNAGTTGNGAIAVAFANDGSADVMNVRMSAAGGADLQALTANDAETINFFTDDSATTTTGIAHVVSALTAGDLTTVTVTGDAGLNLTYTGTTLTTFDASGVTDGAVTYTTGALAAASTITGSTNDGDTLNAANAVAAVTMYGLGGNDSLTGSSTKANTIYGGAGNDTITGGSMADVIDGGEGTDTFVANLAEQAGVSTTDGAVINLSDTALTQAGVFTATGHYLTSAAPTVAANTATYLFDTESTTNASVVDTLVSIENVTGTTGTDYIVGSSAANTITGGAGADVMTGGSGADTFAFVAGDTGTPSATNFDTITDYVTGTDKIDFTAGNLALVAEGTIGVGQAAISATGFATFNAADDTLAERIAAVEAAMTAATAVARETAVFAFGADSYVFVSDGVAGVGANDVLIKLTGIVAATGITLTLGDITAIA
jgi:S-layer protein